MSVSPVIYGCEGLRLNAEERAFFKAANPAGYILFARNIKDPEQVKALVADFYSLTDRPVLPILIDQEGGRVARLRPPHWPEYAPAGHFAALEADNTGAGVSALSSSIKAMAGDLKALGITVDCLPVLDVPAVGADNIIGDRAYGATAEMIIRLGRVAIDALLEAGIMPVIKHIPGHGRAMCDSHLDLPRVKESFEILASSDFRPFKALRFAPFAMTAHIVYEAIDPDNPATWSQKIVNDVIRTYMGFEGILMTDDIGMKALQGPFADRAEKALAAGCDLVLHCSGNMEEMQSIQSIMPQLCNDKLSFINNALSQKLNLKD